jgi:hypothetical protein
MTAKEGLESSLLRSIKVGQWLVYISFITFLIGSLASNSHLDFSIKFATRSWTDEPHERYFTGLGGIAALKVSPAPHVYQIASYPWAFYCEKLLC